MNQCRRLLERFKKGTARRIAAQSGTHRWLVIHLGRTKFEGQKVLLPLFLVQLHARWGSPASAALLVLFARVADPGRYFFIR
jgi:hypothetical protein